MVISRRYFTMQALLPPFSNGYRLDNSVLDLHVLRSKAPWKQILQWDPIWLGGTLFIPFRQFLADEATRRHGFPDTWRNWCVEPSYNDFVPICRHSHLHCELFGRHMCRWMVCLLDPHPGNARPTQECGFSFLIDKDNLGGCGILRTANLHSSSTYTVLHYTFVLRNWPDCFSIPASSWPASFACKRRDD